MERCSVCRKEFSVMGYRDWTYKVKEHGRETEYQCSYRCWRERTRKRTAKYEETVKRMAADEREELSSQR